jgi:acetyl-CoA C-acetyltransferase
VSAGTSGRERGLREVGLLGIAALPVGEHWDLGLRDLGADAARRAMADAGVEGVDAIYVGNMASGALCAQENVGVLIADAAGLLPVEAVKIEAACASGGAAVRAACQAVAGGLHERVLAIGVEKMTDLLGDGVTAALATAADADFEAAHGISFVALNALLMRRYMDEHRLERREFAPFAVLAHRNARHNPHAFFRREITADAFTTSPLVADPIGVLDSAPICDGAAAVVIAPLAECRRRAAGAGRPPAVRVRASAAATDTLLLAARRDPLVWDSVARSAARALEEAGVGRRDLDFYEPHDAFTIVTTLSLEACGFAERGAAVRDAAQGRFEAGGELPICTLGGLKGRGHPVGASGTYQIVEAALQLQGRAGGAQLRKASLAMTQSVGGSGSIAVTHVLEAV